MTTPTPDPLTLEHVRTLVERGGLTMEDHFAVKDEAWNIARLALKVAAELDKSQERVRLLEYDNEGHALYMGELYTTMQAEMPEHRSTVLLGRLLERWGCTSGERQYVPAVEHADALADARQEVERVRGALAVVADHVQDMGMLVSALDIDVESENMTSYQALCDRINDADGVLAAVEVDA